MESCKTEGKRRAVGYAVYGAVVALALAAYFLFGGIKPEYDVNVWFSVSPKGMIDASGESMTTWLRVGSENKTIVLFCGGGLSIDDYTAARPYSVQGREDSFYSDNGSADLKALLDYGILSRNGENPFRSWNIIAIAYSTADFHVGDGEYAYQTLAGDNAVLHHHGYKNYQAVMNEALRYIPETEELIVCGYSAGGYAAALLMDDILENYYPETENVTLCVDSALMLSDKWADILGETWNAPEAITALVKSDDLVSDCFSALYEKYGERITYLYTGSVRDGELTRYQSYLNTGDFTTDTERALHFSDDLSAMLGRLRAAVPTLGVYIFEQLPYFTASMEQEWFSPEMFGLTQHTVLPRDASMWPLVDGVDALHWLKNAADGEVESHGLALLD